MRTKKSRRKRRRLVIQHKLKIKMCI
jgi:hypothetical protein